MAVLLGIRDAALVGIMTATAAPTAVVSVAMSYELGGDGELAAEINSVSEKTGLAEKTRTEFISQVSHELRTPLTAITGWAETIAFDPEVKGDSLKGVQIISKEAERLTNMVTELLEFTRIQDGRFNLARDPRDRPFGRLGRGARR